MANEDELRIALSPVQLAAVLSDESVTEGETLSNRLLGGLGLAGGVVELMGAGVLCYAPDPTFITKVGCVVVGTHSLDSIKAASNQMLTGHPTTTDTYQSAVLLAQTLGADRETAYNVGLTVDIAVPFVFAGAVGAARVTSVRMGRVKLVEHESVSGKYPGGHTLARHINITPEALIARLARRPKLIAASTFRSVKEAEKYVSVTVKANRADIVNWMKYASPGSRLSVYHNFTESVGYGVLRGSTDVYQCHRVGVVIEFTRYNGKPYFILSAFPAR